MTKRCATCRHWSEMIAMVEAGTTVAMCMSPNSSESGKYKAKWGSCDHHEDGPPDDLNMVPAGQRERSIAYRRRLSDEAGESLGKNTDAPADHYDAWPELYREQ